MSNDHNQPPGSCVDLLNAAIHARAQGNSSEAMTLLERALKLAESKWGRDNPITDLIRKDLAKHSSGDRTIT